MWLEGSLLQFWEQLGPWRWSHWINTLFLPLTTTVMDLYSNHWTGWVAASYDANLPENVRIWLCCYSFWFFTDIIVYVIHRLVLQFPFDHILIVHSITFTWVDFASLVLFVLYCFTSFAYFFLTVKISLDYENILHVCYNVVVSFVAVFCKKRPCAWLIFQSNSSIRTDQ